MSNYTTLVGARTVEGSIRNWVNRTNPPATTILTEAQALIYQRLRCREMVQTATGTLAIGADAIDLSTEVPRFRQPVTLLFTGTATLSRHKPTFKRSIEVVQNAWEWDGDGNRVRGLPLIWSYEGANLQFDKPTDVARPWRLTYHGALAALSASNETNFLTERYPKMLRAACLAQVADFDKAARERNHWYAVLMDEIAQANVDADLEYTGAETDYDFEA
jgi:hypothetical protein